jgi:hypothetical protein
VKFSVFALLFSVAIGATAFAEDAPVGPPDVVLTVKVTNGTAQGAAVTGDPVSVRIYQNQQLTDTLQGTVDATGQAVFENVPAPEQVFAVPSAKHNGMMFSGRPVALGPGPGSHIGYVTVYEISEDSSQLFVGVHHFIIKAQADYLVITEYMQLANPSDMAVTSKEKDSQGLPVVLKMLLPRGFKNLQFSDYFEAAAVVTTADGFYDTMAMPPGANHHAVFSYTIDIDSATLDIVKNISLPTSEFILFSQLGPQRIEGLGSPSSNMTLADGASAEYFDLSRLNMGDKINFKVTGFNVVKSQRQSWIIMGVVFGVVAFLAVLRLRPKNKQPSSE